MSNLKNITPIQVRCNLPCNVRASCATIIAAVVVIIVLIPAVNTGIPKIIDISIFKNKLIVRVTTSSGRLGLRFRFGLGLGDLA